MVLSEVIVEVRNRGIPVTETQIRWAIRSEKISRPEMDGSLRFVFTKKNVNEIAKHFQSSVPANTGASV